MQTDKIIRDQEGNYTTTQPVTGKEVIDLAKSIISEQIHSSTRLKSPADAREYLALQLAGEERGCFGVLFLSTRHSVICFEKLFFGSLDQCQVYPRIVVQRSLQLNSGALVLCHNHP